MIEQEPGNTGGHSGDRSLTKAALGGVAWNSAGSGVLVLAQIASTAATARLVSPREFGFYATAQAATSLAGYFTLGALGNGIQRRTRLGPRTVGTAVVISLGMSLLVGGALFLGAGVWAHAWGVPEAASTVRLIAVTLMLTSLAIVPIALIRRNLRFGLAATIETASQVMAMGSGVALATQTHSAQSLATGQVLGACLLLIAAVAVGYKELRPAFDRSDARELFTFASQVNSLGFIASVIIAAPSWFVARTFGASDLGFYSRAALIVGMPANYATKSVYSVLYPLYGRVREDMARTRTLLEEALTLTTGIGWPLFALLAGAAPVIVPTLLGDRWGPATPLIPFFALAACAYVPCGLLTNAAEAMGWMRTIFVREAILLIATAAGLTVVYLVDLDLSWVLIAVAIAQWFTYAWTLEPFVRRRGLDGERIVRTHLVHGGMALGAFATSALAARLLSGIPLSLQVAVQIVIAVGVLGTLLRGRSWIPATQVLAQRIGVPPDEGIIHFGLGTWR